MNKQKTFSEPLTLSPLYGIFVTATNDTLYQDRELQAARQGR